jgi:RNA polymerase-binding transcription factor DksA
MAKGEPPKGDAMEDDDEYDDKGEEKEDDSGDDDNDEKEENNNDDEVDDEVDDDDYGDCDSEDDCGYSAGPTPRAARAIATSTAVCPA